VKGINEKGACGQDEEGNKYLISQRRDLSREGESGLSKGGWVDVGGKREGIYVWGFIIKN